MIIVIGTVGCSKCEKVRNKLEKSKVEYEYKCITECSNKEKDFILALAKEKNISTFPLILKDGQLITEGDI